MPKSTPIITMRNYGVYSRWDAESKQLPKILKFTTRVQARVDVEFGFIVNIKRAKNQCLSFCIDHPGILAANGERREPFEGDVYIRTNDWDFYLGDTIWEPIADKLGPWRMSLAMNGIKVAEKTFELFAEEAL